MPKFVVERGRDTKTVIIDEKSLVMTVDNVPEKIQRFYVKRGFLFFVAIEEDGTIWEERFGKILFGPEPEEEEEE